MNEKLILLNYFCGQKRNVFRVNLKRIIKLLFFKAKFDYASTNILFMNSDSRKDI